MPSYCRDLFRWFLLEETTVFCQTHTFVHLPDFCWDKRMFCGKTSCGAKPDPVRVTVLGAEGAAWCWWTSFSRAGEPSPTSPLERWLREGPSCS